MKDETLCEDEDYKEDTEKEVKMLTNEGCDTLKRFLEQEAAYKPKEYCLECRK